jgi:hypothetical protein
VTRLAEQRGLRCYNNHATRKQRLGFSSQENHQENDGQENDREKFPNESDNPDRTDESYDAGYNCQKQEKCSIAQHVRERGGDVGSFSLPC